jgi:phage FluMu protein Com
LAIEFHCDHCNKLIKAPNEAGGNPGKCPHCQGVNYIPMAPESRDEIPLAPVDEEFEQRRRRAALEDAAVQQRLLKERATPGEPGGKRRGELGAGSSHSPGAGGQVLSSKQFTTLVVNYVEAMSQGTLEKAEEISQKLSRYPGEVSRVLDDMLREDLTAYGLPALPRPVLLGFLKQLRSRLT